MSDQAKESPPDDSESTAPRPKKHSKVATKSAPNGSAKKAKRDTVPDRPLPPVTALALPAIAEALPAIEPPVEEYVDLVYTGAPMSPETASAKAQPKKRSAGATEGATKRTPQKRASLRPHRELQASTTVFDPEPSAPALDLVYEYVPPDKPSSTRRVVKGERDKVAAQPRRLASSLLFPTIAVIIGGIMSMRAMWPAPPVIVPATVVGEWVSDNRQYANSRLSISRSEFFIGDIREKHPLRAPIVGFKSSTRQDTMAFVLAYLVEGRKVELRAKLVKGAEPILYFENPKGLAWHLVPNR